MAGRSSVKMMFSVLATWLLLSAVTVTSTGEASGLRPHVFVTILARNTAHTLGDFLGFLEQLDYPKERISVWIRTDHNEDSTPSLLEEWRSRAGQLYASVDYENSDAWMYPTFDPYEPSDERYLLLSQLRQAGLEAARLAGADYLMSVDTDNFLVNNRTLSLLIAAEKPIVAPMLRADKEAAFSNYWCGQDANGYYKRTPDYMPILSRENVGCFQVAVVHSTYLIDLNSEGVGQLAFWPAAEGFTGPVDDVVQFAYSAKSLGIGMYILNTEEFGYIIKPSPSVTVQEAVNKYVDFKLQTLVNHAPIPVSPHVTLPERPRYRMGLDAIYMIGLERRTDRRTRMLDCLETLSLDYTMIDAVDGKKINQTYIDSLGIHYLPGWKDPWGERPMTFGEVGCFLSHYFIWERMVAEDLQQVLVLEDDVDFESGFRKKIVQLLSEAENYTPDWDLIYIGRKALHWRKEKLVTGATMLAIPHYSYWTLGYLLSRRGAVKLLEAKPLEKMLPVDEYFPIMYNRHPETDWAAAFSPRTLQAYSAYPLLAFPTHYVGDEGWYSDTEPPMEVLQRIREKKKREEEEEEKKLKEDGKKKAEMKEQALQRTIASLKSKLKPKSEL